jgi:hypothetical protein
MLWLQLQSAKVALVKFLKRKKYVIDKIPNILLKNIPVMINLKMSAVYGIKSQKHMQKVYLF